MIQSQQQQVSNIPVQLVPPQPSSNTTTPTPLSPPDPVSTLANNNTSIQSTNRRTLNSPNNKSLNCNAPTSPTFVDDSKASSSLYGPAFQDSLINLPTGPPGSGPDLDECDTPSTFGGSVAGDLDDLKPTPVIRKRKKQMVSEECKDDKYWERRRKNNMAAKRSRDARRAKENQIAVRASFLERENKALAQELSKSRAENHLLRERLCKYEVV
jgi:hypothetical protein